MRQPLATDVIEDHLRHERVAASIALIDSAVNILPAIDFGFDLLQFRPLDIFLGNAGIGLEQFLFAGQRPAS